MKAIDNTSAEKWVVYYRVSTKRQNLGLDAQRAKVQAAAASAGATIIEEVEEKESGKECARPGLNRVMAIARKNNAVIVVAKHDRLSRDLAYASELVFKKGLRFNILNLPPEATSDQLLFGVYFGLAAREAQMISERTKAALQALKDKGVKLGRPDAKDSITREMISNSVEVRKRRANENPNNIAASNEIRRYLMDDSSKKGYSAIARHLNDRGLYTSTGVFHDAKSVKLLCHRYGIEIKKRG